MVGVVGVAGVVEVECLEWEEDMSGWRCRVVCVVGVVG